MRDEFLRTFEERWNHINAMTTGFSEIVPDVSWNAAPIAGFAPFSKQLRHVVCVRGVYNEGLRTGRVRFDRKHEFYDGALSRSALIEALGRTHAEVVAELSALPEDLFAPSIDLYGNRVSHAQYLYGYVQHEALHHGQWSIYAAAGGYETPSLWRLQWGLGAGAV